jgi:GTPase SAR1 family protein
MVVFDVSQRSSFEHVGKWVQGLRDVCGEDVPIVLIGNKADLPQREIPMNDGVLLAKKLGLVSEDNGDAPLYVETSALHNAASVDQAFMTLFNEYRNQSAVNTEEKARAAGAGAGGGKVDVSTPAQPVKKKGCC